MKKYILFLVFVFTAVFLFSAHNLTINGEESSTVSLGDDLVIYFEYENIGNNATLSLMIDIPIIDTSALDFLQGELIDGSSLDTTPVDGVFQGTITAFWQPPTGLPLIITVVDEDVSDDASVTFIELNSTFSISGSITQESNYGFDLPVYPALVNSFYNTNLTDFTDFDFEAGIEEWLSFFENRYFISEVNSFLGYYSITIPDTIPNVPCIVMPVTMLDFDDSHTSPLPYFGQVNGSTSNIDFLYTLPDGIFSGTVVSSEGNPITSAGIDLYCEESLENAFALTDESGAFSIPLNNGTYTLMVTAYEYQPYLGEITMNNQDINMDISLTAVANEDQDVEALNLIKVSAYPNPFAQALNIEIKLPRKHPSSVKIYNLKGQLVNTLTNANSTSENFTWNGKDANNKAVANGIYYLRVKQGQQVVNKKVVLMK